ncbi:hypothetical protein K1719_035745 [Acacia pycnantha]|nr:hypothetical protein K1719_035745 [Acacia pycnantha]
MRKRKCKNVKVFKESNMVEVPVLGVVSNIFEGVEKKDSRCVSTVKGLVKEEMRFAEAHIRERLDRAICNTSWIEVNQNAQRRSTR